MWKYLLAGVALLIVCCGATTLQAEEASAGVKLEPRRMVQGGIICDEPGQVIQYIEMPMSGFPPGCGKLMKPLWADVYLTGVHEFGDLKFLLARYEFPFQDGDTIIQYGYWGKPVTEEAEVEPAKGELL